MRDLLITGGLLVDGTGASGRASDIRIRDGRIAEIATGLEPQGERLIDARGAIVSPGFIDSHTHYDAAIYWDPMCDPMPQHGVTAVVAGNCSLGLAPVRAHDRAQLVDVFSYIEDLPAEVLATIVPWTWESFADYAQELSQRGLGLNFFAFVGHSQLRTYVMGEAAWERAATEDEIRAMADELERGIRAGAIGLSASQHDKDRSGRPVPSCIADDAELDALMAVLGKHGARFQFIPHSATADMVVKELERVGRLMGRHGVVGIYNVVAHVDSQPERAERIMACLEGLHRRGIMLWGMATPRPFELSIGFEHTMNFLNVPAWNELVQAGPDEKRRLIDDPAWRSRARSDADACPLLAFPFKRPELLRIGIVTKPALESWVGRTLADLVEARGGHVADVLADWVKENDFKATVIFAKANTDKAEVARILKSPVTFVSGSDAGAHLQLFCAAGDSTLLLTRYVRERGDMSLEAAVHALTGRQAEVLGLKDRGVLAPGNVADIAIFALDELHYGPEYMVKDIPGGRPRLTRDPGGYRYTIVDGEIVQESGKATGALPARWQMRAE
jgi:N-acyl-D-aspartate/D-glutamate deacylase